MVEYITETAIVRIHPGKMSDEERKDVIKNARETKAFVHEILSVSRQRGSGNPFRTGSVCGVCGGSEGLPG